MEKRKQDVIFQPSAEKSVFQIYCYIVKQGYPEMAENFYDQLYDFGYTLRDFPVTYPICRFPKFAHRKMHCAVFHKNYIFVYKQVKNTLVVYNVIHSRAMK